MKFFQRKSNWERVRGLAQTAAADDSARQAGKLALTAAGGAAVVTLASAVVSSVRRGSRS
ncbi:MAG TPA: hypothetical protein VGG25_31140 [Streptosporangiaceae bacterium]